MMSEYEKDKAVCDAATAGPWNLRSWPVTDWDPEDADFINRARTRWPAALDEIERLRKTVDEWEKDFNTLCCERDALRDALDLMFHFVPAWAENVPIGCDSTMYGTGTPEGDRAIKRKVDDIRALLEGMEGKP